MHIILKMHMLPDCICFRCPAAFLDCHLQRVNFVLCMCR